MAKGIRRSAPSVRRPRSFRVPGAAVSPLGVALGVLESEVAELATEIRRLKEKARLIESENKSLRRRLALAVTPDPDLAAQEDNLFELYREGFHVCQLYFGKRLEGGCLFCASLLRRRLP